MSDTLFCKDCKYSRPSSTGEIDDMASCFHVKSMSENLVTGKPEFLFCSTMRKAFCGQNAKLFEGKDNAA